MKSLKQILMITVSTGLAAALSGCGTSSATGSSDGSTSQIAAGSLGGAANEGTGSYALVPPAPHRSVWERVEGWFTLVPEAYAFDISCSGGKFSMSPGGSAAAYAGAGTYYWQPVSCSITFRNGLTTSVAWSIVGGSTPATFTYDYGTQCTGSGYGLFTQGNGCAVTRTTPSLGSPEGITRTLTGFDGNQYAVTIDTNNPDGYNSAITTTAGAGSVATCTAASCGSRTLVLNGTHISATVTPAGGTASQFWDHTVTSDPADPIEINGVGTSRVINSGTVIVQHNLAKFTAYAKVSVPLTYTLADCCFPTSGSLVTTFSGGANDGKSEALTFSNQCGEATLTQPNGDPLAITLQHCL